MIASVRIDPTTPQNPPPSPTFSPSAPPAFLSAPYGTPSPMHQQNMAASQQPPSYPMVQQGMLNVPMMEYSVPGTIQTQQPLGYQQNPPPTLKPMPQPPPAPALNEVSLNEERVRVRCPFCYASINTKVNYSTGMMTHIAAVAVLVVCFPLAWVPYCVDCCKDVDHSCPNCGRAIGKFKRFQ